MTYFLQKLQGFHVSRSKKYIEDQMKVKEIPAFLDMYSRATYARSVSARSFTM